MDTPLFIAAGGVIFAPSPGCIGNQLLKTGTIASFDAATGR
jgi:hypothetical protein